MNDVAHAYNMRIQFDPHQCQLAPREVEKMLAGLESLGEQVKNFPVSDLHVLIERNNRSNDYSVKTSLMLTGETLVSFDHDPMVYTAFERCVNNLIENVRAYKERLGNLEERSKQEKGTHQSLLPTTSTDPAAIDSAVAAGDYAAFRTATLPYEEPLRKRVGRWVERFPELDAQIDRGLKINDVVEEVFLTAFEDYGKRPPDERFGEWLEGLINPAVKELLQHRDRELENINLARSAVEAEGGPSV
jgi:ribosome-associated translation inhibitor RaiA